MVRMGRYGIIRELGRGGMGVVYLAEDPTIGRHVAVKTIRVDRDSTPEEAAALAERLLREARAAGNLSHPNIVAVHDAGQEREFFYVVMEFVSGCALDKILAERRFDSGESLRILEGAAAALDFAHAHGIVHRDVKPANIMIRDDGLVKLADFGIARAVRSQTHSRTRGLVGSPGYLSPEQLRAQPATGRSDQFSLAVVAYELITGRKPFEADTVESLFAKILFEEVPPLGAVWPELPVDVDRVFRKALAKDPAARFATCGEFVHHLRQAASGIPAGVDAAQTTVPIPPRAGPARKELSKSAWVPALVIAAVLAACAGGVWFVREWQQDAGMWSAVKDSGYRELVESYLEQRPHGRFVSAARDKIQYLRREEESWEKVKDRQDIRVLQDFLRQYPAGRFSLEARVLIEALKAKSGRSDSETRPTEKLPAEKPGPVTVLTPSPFRPGEVRVNRADGLEYAWIPPGEFRMGLAAGDRLGSEEDEAPHSVVLTKGFWITRTEVPVAAYKKYLQRAGLKLPGEEPAENPGWRSETYPMTGVNWSEAQAFCAWAGGKLPTEAQWERAARAGSENSGTENLETVAWFRANSGYALHGVASRQPNAWGLFDMQGNAREWCLDWFDGGYYKHGKREDPAGPESGTRRVQRGGSANDVAAWVRFSFRRSEEPDDRYNKIGFRCACDALP